MIGLFLPTKTEYDAMDHDRLRELGVIPILCGIGKINMVYALAANVMRVRAFVLCGFAGGYRKLSIGEIVQPFEVRQGDFKSEGLDSDGEEPLICLGIPVPNVRHALFMCQDQIIKGQTLNVLKQIDTIAVDMETYAFLEFMRRAGIGAFSIVRVISDLCGENAKEQFLQAGKTLAGQLRTAAELAVDELKNKGVV